MAKVSPKVKGAVGGAVVGKILEPAVNVAIAKGGEIAGDIVDKIREQVFVPQFYSPKYQMTTEQAIKELENRGLKAELYPISTKHADKKYVDCIENQVIETEPKAHMPAKPGQIIRVLYATQEFIDESVRLAEEYDRQVAERKEKTKQLAADSADLAKQAASKTADKAVQVAAGAVGKLKQAKDKLPKKKGEEPAELNEPSDVIEAVELSETVETIEE